MITYLFVTSLSTAFSFSSLLRSGVAAPNFSFFVIVLSFLFSTQTQFHTLSGCNRGIHFLPLFVLPFCFLPFSSVDSSVSKPGSLQQGCILSSSLWFSYFFPSSSLHNLAYKRDIHFLLWFSFFFLYIIQLVTEIYTFFLSGYPFSFLYTIQLVTEEYVSSMVFLFLFFTQFNL
ncbi:unnamed protein product [Acanthosepion pharaonis]|uniref:Uncharacterized protein n=1 Tax=Acanthosepion pharaonis TaxID=158019 RepID=A0A812ASF7_ACAPH|nr:unnamed protein product [Sepia pharaonis]